MDGLTTLWDTLWEHQKIEIFSVYGEEVLVVDVPCHLDKWMILKNLTRWDEFVAKTSAGSPNGVRRCAKIIEQGKVWRKLVRSAATRVAIEIIHTYLSRYLPFVTLDRYRVCGERRMLYSGLRKWLFVAGWPPFTWSTPPNVPPRR